MKLPPRSPNLNAYAERFVRSIKEDCLDRMILFGEQGLRTALREFFAHYHSERNHQGLGNRLILTGRIAKVSDGAMRRHSVLEGFSITTIERPDPGEAIFWIERGCITNTGWRKKLHSELGYFAEHNPLLTNLKYRNSRLHTK